MPARLYHRAARSRIWAGPAISTGNVDLCRIRSALPAAKRSPSRLRGWPVPRRAAGGQGQLTWGVHISLAPTWFDPAETPGIITPFMVMYALHDAVVKPMPGNPLAPSLAESWSMSKDGLVYEFVLRKGVRFHNGEPVTAEDVKFSLERYRGGGAATLKARVAGGDLGAPQHAGNRLKPPRPN